MANYPQELVQDAVCQSHTGHMTGLWFLPNRPLRLNTSEKIPNNKTAKQTVSPPNGIKVAYKWLLIIQVKTRI